MIFALIIFILLIAFLCCFFGFNLTNMANLWLFTTFENVPVAVVVLISFGAGMVFAVLCIFLGKLKKSLSSGTESSDETEEKPKSSDKKKKRFFKKDAVPSEGN